MSDDELTFPGGLPHMLDRYESRRSPFQFGIDPLPDLDVNLDAMTRQKVPETATELSPGRNTRWQRKRAQIAKEFVGNSELAFLNAQLISNLRKRSFPRHAPALFCRLWDEQSEHLLNALDLRWLVSSIQTFADHGQTATQREVGQALRMLFGMMKLYEYERLFSGLPPETAFQYQDKNHVPLPYQMRGFSLKTGGLDVNLIAPVWTKALNDPTISALVDHLMTELNRDPGSIFRRLEHMRQTRKPRK